MAKKSSAILDELEAFVGEWKMESMADGEPVVTGKTTFAWLAGRSFLIQHSVADPPLPTTPQIWIDNSPFPIVAIIGLDDPSGDMYYVYSDGRGVHRVYQMSLKDGIWKVWGQAGPEFYQRFEGKFSNGGNTLTVRIERSKDKKNWELDFDTVYKRVG
jgi:hypothetical protein